MRQLSPGRPMLLLTCFLLLLLAKPTSSEEPECVSASAAQACLALDIRSSHHDFSGAAWSGREACRPCHIPHNATTAVPNAPIWSHQLSAASYSIYASPTFNAAGRQPTGHTKLCLSCHDGTVAIENHAGYTGGIRYVVRGSVGIDLRNDHPVSFDYSTALASSDGELHDPATTPSGLGGTIASDLLENGSVQCTSCHDPHISRNSSGCGGCHNIHGQMYMESLSLRMSNRGSALCLTCHRK